VDSYARDDGLWDLEAELIDVKSYDYTRAGRTIHPAGKPVHHMHLRITIDDAFAITAVAAAYDAAPYNEHCSSVAPNYQDLIGMNLLRKFRDAVKDRFGRAEGCTHMTELAYVLPTVAIQSMSSKRRKESQGPGRKRPFQIDGCHALQADGQVVKEFYPEWYVAPRPTGKQE
jgi:hypothetical protein